MHNIDFYVERAKKINGFKSDRQLSTNLGLSPTVVGYWMRGKTYPSDDTMVELAKICDVPVEQALVELSFWRADGEAKEGYKSVWDKMQKVACYAIMLSAIPSIAHASSYSIIPSPNTNLCNLATELLYIMENKVKNIKRGFLNFIKDLRNPLFTQCNPLSAC